MLIRVKAFGRLKERLFLIMRKIREGFSSGLNVRAEGAIVRIIFIFLFLFFILSHGEVGFVMRRKEENVKKRRLERFSRVNEDE